MIFLLWAYGVVSTLISFGIAATAKGKYVDAEDRSFIFAICLVFWPLVIVGRLAELVAKTSPNRAD